MNVITQNTPILLTTKTAQYSLGVESLSLHLLSLRYSVNKARGLRLHPPRALSIAVPSSWNNSQTKGGIRAKGRYPNATNFQGITPFTPLLQGGPAAFFPEDFDDAMKGGGDEDTRVIVSI